MLPMEKRRKSETGLTVKHSEQEKKGDEIDQPEDTFGHTGKGRANPKAGEPEASMLPALVTTDCTKNPAGDKSTEDRFGHNDSSQKKRAAAGKINQTSQKAVPVITQSLPD